MLGGNHPDRSGNILHARLLYYDPARSRVGLPADVGALVEKVGPDSVRVRLVNLDPVEARSVVVQAGAYGEHRFGAVRSQAGTTVVNAERFEVRLAPGSGGALDVSMELFVNPPRLRRAP
jgi:hypothetical protein